MRVLLWHGWLLEGAGSNIHTARVAERLRAEGHDVLLLCQQRRVERYPWIDASGAVGPDGPSALVPNPTASSAPGRCVLLRPSIGSLLPVFVVDEYEGFEVKAFVDLTDDELGAYLARNVEALRAAEGWHHSEVAITGHAIPGAALGARALGPGRFVAKVHGSDIEYAIRHQERYRELAGEGLLAAHAVVGASEDVLQRCRELVPGIARSVPIRPGVDTHAFRPRERRQALLELAHKLELDPDTARGRPASLDAEVADALGDEDALTELAGRYDQEVPDPDAAPRLRRLAEHDGPIVGYLGKLIPQKGVELLFEAVRRSELESHVLVVGFGTHRERLQALAMELQILVTFTGRLDHRYAPWAVAAMDVQVVPSILAEAFGMVVAEGAAAGALPLVARHSGLAEVATALEGAVSRPGLLSFEPGEGAAASLAHGLDRLLALPSSERERIRRALSAFVAREWSWERTASRLLEVATGLAPAALGPDRPLGGPAPPRRTG